MKRYLLLALLMLSAALNSLPEMTFETDTYDFKEWKEVDGPFSYTYNFTNTGDEPVVISKIQSGCGCSSSSWSTGKIMPGKKGFVKVTFNPKRQAGRHNKRIKIYANTANEFETVTMKGHITGAPRKKSKTPPKFTVKHISSEEAYEILYKNYGNSVIIDASSPKFFKETHIEGAVNLSPKTEELEVFLKESGGDKFYIVYANEYESALNVAQRIVKHIIPNVFVLEGGLKEWNEKDMNGRMKEIRSRGKKNKEFRKGK